MQECVLSDRVRHLWRAGRHQMDERVTDFVEHAAQTLVGLDVALFYQANPRTFDTAAGVALRTHRSVEAVEPALQRLAECGILEVFSRGDGRFRCYALRTASEVWNVLCLVSEAYHDDPQSRKEIVRLLVARRLRDREALAESPEPEQEVPPND